MTLDDVKSVEDLREFCRVNEVQAAYDHPDICNLLMNIDALDYAERSGLSLATVHERFSHWALSGKCPYAYDDAPCRAMHFCEEETAWAPIANFTYDDAYDTLYALNETWGFHNYICGLPSA